jgi:hypothetical protein
VTVTKVIRQKLSRLAPVRALTSAGAQAGVRRALALAALFGSLLLASDVELVAATQGTQGATSTGSIDLTITIPTRTRISALNDILLGAWSGSGALSGGDANICIWSTTGGYSVTARGSGGGNAFTLTNGAQTVAYTVQWAQTGGASSGTALTTGVALTGRTTNATAIDCSTGPASTAGVFVSIPESTLAASRPGSYTGTLTLVIRAT